MRGHGGIDIKDLGPAEDLFKGEPDEVGGARILDDAEREGRGRQDCGQDEGSGENMDKGPRVDAHD